MDPDPGSACSTVGPSFGELQSLGGGRFGWVSRAHWDGTPESQINGDWGFPPFVAYWLTIDAPSAEPMAQRLVAPDGLKGSPQLVSVLPDGSAWWAADRQPENEPPEHATCGSWVLATPEDAPRGRLTQFHALDLRFHDQGGVTALRYEDGAVSLWHGDPVPLSAWSEPADTSDWSSDWKTRQRNRRLDGWTRSWVARLPFDQPRGYGQPAIALDPTGGLLGLVASNWETVRTAVFTIEGRDTATTTDDRLRPRYDRTWPRARNGLSTTPGGAFALTQPWAVAVSSAGDLAMGRWQSHSDCSTDRPPGMLIFDPEGELAADVRGTPDHPSPHHLIFDEGGRLWATGDMIQVLDLDGTRIATTRQTPRTWLEQQERLTQEVCALDGSSDAAEWARLYGVYSEWQCEHPPEIRRIGRAKIIDAWPDVDHLLSDALWLDELADPLCARYGAPAATAAVRRFEASRTHRQRLQWMRVLPTCTNTAPASAVALARQGSERQGREEREVARAALAAWGEDIDATAQLWQRVIEGLDSDDRRVRHRAAEAAQELLASLATTPADFEERLLRGHAAQREAALLVLRGALFRRWHEYVRPEDEATRSAVLAGAADWLRSPNEELREVGGLLLLANDAWPDAIDGPKPDAVLGTALAARGDRSLWATLAVSHLLDAHAVRIAMPDLRRVIPGSEEVGLSRDLVARLLHDSSRAARIRHTERLRSRDELLSQIEQPRQTLLRSLGDIGRAQLMSAIRRAPLPAEGRAWFLPELWEAHAWMVEDITVWSEEEIGLVLDHFEADPNTGWQAGPLLDAVGSAYPDDHSLDARARALFLYHLDEAKEIAQAQKRGEVDPRALQPPRHPRTGLFGQMVSHLLATDDMGQRSVLLEEATPDDVRVLVEADPRGLTLWLGLMSATGPWPEIVPELERQLDGNTKIQAAQVLAHLQHPAALEVLVQTSGSPFQDGGTFAALERYGELATRQLARSLEPALGGHHGDRLSTLLATLLLADEQARDSFLIGQKLAVEPRPPSSDGATDGLDDQLARHIDQQIAAHQWPRLSYLFLLSVYGQPAVEPTLAAVQRGDLVLEDAPLALRAATPRERAWWLEQIADRVEDPEAPLHRTAVEIARAVQGATDAELLDVRQRLGRLPTGLRVPEAPP